MKNDLKAYEMRGEKIDEKRNSRQKKKIKQIGNIFE